MIYNERQNPMILSENHKQTMRCVVKFFTPISGGI